MAINLSGITFSNQTDIVPLSGVEEIANSGSANTFGGNDVITGTGSSNTDISFGIHNWDGTEESTASINTGDGNDVITGTSSSNSYGFGIFNWGFINTGEGNDVITGAGTGYGIYNYSYTMYDYEIPRQWKSETRMDTGDGNDVIIGSSSGVAIDNDGVIFTGNGNDSIISYGRFYNYENVDLGEGNDSILVTGEVFNGGSISAGNGNDSVITYGSFNREGYGSGVNLEDGNDYFYGFGSGYFSGGNGEDIMELPPGSYTIEISFNTVKFTEDSTFTDTSQSQKAMMNPLGFEELIAGGTTYDFSSLTNGQTILVA
jgi:hypothetical protein